ncbi:MAG: SdpI family protein [archaeon]|jgi:uncharacterized membrane protein
MKAAKQKTKKVQKEINSNKLDLRNRINILLIVILVIISFLVSFVAYNALPETMTIHWGINGEANGFAPKTIGIMIMPIITLILVAILIAVPKLDPLKGNIESFKEKYYDFITIFCAFMLYLHAITILLNFGIQANMIALLAPAFALLMYYMGILLGSAKRNYFIGIRTPWTLDNETVWNKTHKLGEKLFKLSAAISILGVIFPNQAIILILAPIIISSIYLVGFSYLEHKKQLRK